MPLSTEHTGQSKPHRAMVHWATSRIGRPLVIAPPYLWLALFFLIPFAMVLRIALSDTAQALPPYTPHWLGLDRIGEFLSQLSFGTFATLAVDTLYLDAYLSSLRLAGISTLIALVVGFPVAYAMSCAPKRWQPALLVAVILPFWTSFLIRVYAWIAILKPEGVLNAALSWAGFDLQIQILDSETAVLIGMVYSYLPFMVLPLYTSLERLDRSLLEAAADLGSPPWKSFWTITVPLALPGVIAGCFLVFIPAVGEFVIPDLLGGPDTLMIGKVLWTEFFSNRDWPVSSAVAVVLLLILLGPILLFHHLTGERRGV